MKTETAIPENGNIIASASLHHLVNCVSNSLGPAILRNKNLIINNVPEGICSEVNEDLVASVLGQLMNLVILHTKKSCIRISAKTFGNIVLMHVKDDGCLNYDSISHHLAEIQSQAEKLGGFVGFTSYRNKLTTIAFSFINDEDICLKTIIPQE